MKRQIKRAGSVAVVRRYIDQFRLSARLAAKATEPLRPVVAVAREVGNMG